MSTPSNVVSPLGRFIDVRQGTPTVSIAVKPSWRGNSLAPLRSFPTLARQSLVVRGNGRFDVVDPQVGPRIGAERGTIDVWFKMGSGADSIVLAQSTSSSATAPLITLGVDASGRTTGSIHDAAGTTQTAWTASSMSANAQGVLIHMQVAWDATLAINGARHVKVFVNGVAMPTTDFTTLALVSWTPFQPLYLATGTFTETDFDGEMILTQAATRVVI